MRFWGLCGPFLRFVGFFSARLLALEPVYGWRLDVDTCCETVAWFFEPYWSADKIADYTRRVVQRTGSPFPGARGVPFFGLYVGRPDADKPPRNVSMGLRQ